MSEQQALINRLHKQILEGENYHNDDLEDMIAAWAESDIDPDKAPWVFITSIFEAGRCSVIEQPNDTEGPPQEVIDEWIKQCSCCPNCHGCPCAGVEAGGMCDSMNGQFCRCNETEY